MNQARHRRVAVFCQGILHHRGEGLHFLRAWDDLFTDGVIRIIRVDQGNEIRRDIHTEQTAGLERLTLTIGQRENFLNFFNRI